MPRQVSPLRGIGGDAREAVASCRRRRHAGPRRSRRAPAWCAGRARRLLPFLLSFTSQVWPLRFWSTSNSTSMRPFSGLSLSFQSVARRAAAGADDVAVLGGASQRRGHQQALASEGGDEGARRRPRCSMSSSCVLLHLRSPGRPWTGHWTPWCAEGGRGDGTGGGLEHRVGPWSDAASDAGRYPWLTARPTMVGACPPLPARARRPSPGSPRPAVPPVGRHVPACRDLASAEAVPRWRRAGCTRVGAPARLAGSPRPPVAGPALHIAGAALPARQPAHPAGGGPDRRRLGGRPARAQHRRPHGVGHRALRGIDHRAQRGLAGRWPAS